MNDTLRAVTNVYRVMADQRSQRIHEALNRALPESAWSLSLAQKAALLLRSAPGVSTVLVGMRQSAYVQDVVAGLRHPPLSDGVSLWKTLDTTLDQAVQAQ